MTQAEFSRVGDWINEHGGRLFSLAKALSDDVDEAEDLLQDAWVVAITRAHMVEDRAHVGPWLQRIVINLARSRRRKRQRRRLLRQQWSGGHRIEAITPHMTGQDLSLLDRQTWKAVAELPDLQRRVLLYRIVDDFSTAETAQVIGRAEGTVKASLHRALKTLRLVLPDASARTVGCAKKDDESHE